MLLAPRDSELFFRLYKALMFFVNQRLSMISEPFATPEDFGALSPEIRAKVRDALLANLDLIEVFVAENPAHLSEGELDIVRSWRNLVFGKFYVFRELKKYTVFLSTTGPAFAYGVLALSQPFEELVGPDLPVLIETALLPFQEKIIYDGVMTRYGISYGPGIRRSLNESFKEAKLRHGIVTSLPISAKPVVPAKSPQTKPRPKTNPKEETEHVLATILRLIEPFCQQHLNDEYAALCRKLAEKLARKRPSPLLRGTPSTWACGIVRTIGWVNFLTDKTQTPHLRVSDIDAGFNISESSGATKFATIRKLLKITPMKHEWTLPSKMDDNSMIWMLTVNGFMMDVRNASREIQELAFSKGLIPYIPDDRTDDSPE